MIGLEPLFDFVSLCIWTGAVAGERPASAIIVAPPGCGKTSVLERMRGDSSPFISDMTCRDISGILKNYPRATHILLSDMMALFAHKGPVTQLACATLGALTGDSLKSDPFAGTTIEGGKQMGLITAIPTWDLKNNRKVQNVINGAGFATRFMIVRFDYSLETRLRIHDFIKQDRYTLINAFEPFHVPNQREPISIDTDLANRIHHLSSEVKPKSDGIGTRIHLHLRALCKARARREGRSEVSPEDVDAVTLYGEFFSTQGKIL